MEEKVRRIFLCRHGETEANIQRIYCGGNRESPLNETGRKQAMLLGKALEYYYKFRGSLIVSSTKGRAKETAKIIASELSRPPIRTAIEELKELDLGDWCGKTAEEIQKLFPKEHEEWRNNILKPTFRFPGGESMEEARERMLSCFDFIKEKWLCYKSKSNNDMIVVAHGGTNMIILASILNVKMKTFAYRGIRQNNACVNIIGFSENHPWRPEEQIVLLNSTHHLDIDLKI